MRTHFAYEAEPFEAYTDFELEFEINRSSRDYIKWVQSSLSMSLWLRSASHEGTPGLSRPSQPERPPPQLLVHSPLAAATAVHETPALLLGLQTWSGEPVIIPGSKAAPA
jgi:hypothetical protein